MSAPRNLLRVAEVTRMVNGHPARFAIEVDAAALVADRAGRALFARRGFTALAAGSVVVRLISAPPACRCTEPRPAWRNPARCNVCSGAIGGAS